MPKSIKLNAVIDTISSKKDRSVGLRISTPELTTSERAIFFELQGLSIDLTITPQGEQVDEQVIDKDLNQKSQSQRLRSVLFILWKQHPQDMDFEQYYKYKTEQIIEHLKSKIEE